MKIKCIILFLFGVSLCACFDDKGNYDYRDMADITIENVPEVIEVLGHVGRFRSRHVYRVVCRDGQTFGGADINYF